MLSLGWSEISIIFIIVVIVVGPKEIPNLLKQLGYISKKIKSLSRDFNTSVNNIVKETEIDNIKKEINKVSKLDIKKEIENNDIISEFSDINSTFEKLNDNINEPKDDDKDNNSNKVSKSK